MKRGNVFEGVPPELPDELVTTLVEHAGCRVERIISRGHSTAGGEWYDQDEDEFVLLVSGAARLEFEDGHTVDLAPGDWVDLPAHLAHRVASTATVGDTVWLAVFRPAAARR